MGAEDTFAEDIFDFEAAKSELKPLADKVWRHCEAKLLSGRTVTLKVKFADFRQITRSRTTAEPIAEATDLTEAGISLLSAVFPVEKGIRLLGITMSNFAEPQSRFAEQLSLEI